MTVAIWPQEMEPDFPLAVVEYTARDDTDPMHWHDHLEIALVLGGRGSFLLGRRALAADAGDVFLIDNSQPHVALASEGSELRLLLVLFRPELLAGPGCRAMDVGYLAPFRADERVASPRVRAGSALAQELAPMIQALRVVWDRHDPAERHLADAALRMALALVNRDRAVTAGAGAGGAGAGGAGGAGSAGGSAAARASAARASAARASAARAAADRREQIRPVLAYVDRHCRESVTLEDVAGVVHVSPSRVRHVFKDVTGVSFKEYVTQVRVAEAKGLLLGTEMSVAEVAAAVSYTNLHQFYKVFYRSCSMSPAEYRRYYTPNRAIREDEAVPTA